MAGSRIEATERRMEAIRALPLAATLLTIGFANSAAAQPPPAAPETHRFTDSRPSARRLFPPPVAHALHLGRRRAILGFSMSPVGLAALPIGLRVALANRRECSSDSALCLAVADFYVMLPVLAAAPFIVSGLVFGATGVHRVRRVAWTAAPVANRSTFGFVLRASF